MDDDTDCVEHVWGLEELNLTLDGAEMVSVCVRCGAPSYQPNVTDREGDRRPPL